MITTVPPRQNSILFGHEPILKRLLDIQKRGHLHHSLIFTGPEGVGKETLAYHFMRQILKDDAKVFAGSDPHIFIIQPVYDEKKGRFKRDITKDALEGLTDFLRRVSVDDKPRFVLINPADGMNIDTQNAILKVLEEPPSNVFFLLLATHVASILPTIRSRCLIVPIEPLAEKEFTKALQHYIPEADFDKISAYQQVAQGIIGMVLHYEQKEIPNQYDRFCQICLEWREEKNSVPAMQLAEELALPENEETAQALISLFLKRLATLIKIISMGRTVTPVAPSEGQLFAYWQNVNPQKLLQEYDRLNHIWQEGIDRYLDRKIVILSFLRVVAAMDSAKAAVI